MKKHIRTAAVLMALALLLAGCGGNNSDNTSNTFDRSSVFDENGYWKDITASEYVELCDTSKIEVSQAEIETQKAAFLSYYPNYEQITDRAVADGDTVNIDYVGKIDGVEFEGGSTGGAGTDVTIGVTSYIDDFLEQLIGHMPGETFDVEVTFPEVYDNNPDLAGKDAVFTTTINYIKVPTLAEWDDTFVATNLSSTYGWTTAEEAEHDITASLAEDYVYANSTFLQDIPEVVTNYQIDSALEYYTSYAEAYGMDLETFIINYFGAESLEAFKEDYKAQAKESGEFFIIYQALAEKLGYTVSEEDLKAYFREMNTDAEDPEDYSEYEEAFGKPYLKAMVLYNNMSDKILELTNIVE